MIPSQRHLFDLPREVAYLNCAYMSPLANRVVEAGLAGVRVKARPWTIAAEDFFPTTNRARGHFAALMGAEAQDVSVVPAASYGIALAAANIEVKAGERIVVLADQFPSNIYHWRELAAETGATLATVARPASGDWSPALLEAIGADTALVATAQCHWTDGGLIDLVQVGRRAREVGAALVLDLTQSLGAMPFDVAEVQPDFAVAACYKWLMGPYSLGFCYVAPRHQTGRPLEHGWMSRLGAENFADLLNYRDGFQPGARRHDVGENANFALMPMAETALAMLVEWGPAEIQATLRAYNDAIVERAGEFGFQAAPADLRAGHFLGLRRPGGLPDGLLAALRDQNVHLSVRGDSLRVTPHLYNDEEDAERLFEALGRIL